MDARRVPAATPAPELLHQLEHPSREIVWDRAAEAFGSESLAGNWMRTPLPILADSTPEAYAASNNPGKQREILEILGRIDFGIFA